jgi:hypothetical protein
MPPEALVAVGVVFHFVIRSSVFDIRYSPFLGRVTMPPANQPIETVDFSH